MRHLRLTPHVLSGALLHLLAACQATTAPRPSISAEGILFIGNSLTYVNNLPGYVAAMGAADSLSLQVGTLARADHALIDYVLDGSAASAIRNGKWTHVVMQQGPTTVPVCRDTLVLAVQRIDAVAREIGARSVVLMSWPSTARPGDFPSVLEAAQIAARHVSAPLAAAGDAWRGALAANADLPLYGADGYHPAPLGTWLAAAVVYELVTGRDVRKLPGEPPLPGTVGMSSSMRLMLLGMAHEANMRAALASVPTWIPSTPPSPGIRC